MLAKLPPSHREALYRVRRRQRPCPLYRVLPGRHLRVQDAYMVSEVSVKSRGGAPVSSEIASTARQHRSAGAQTRRAPRPFSSNAGGRSGRISFESKGSPDLSGRHGGHGNRLCAGKAILRHLPARWGAPAAVARRRSFVSAVISGLPSQQITEPLFLPSFCDW